MSKRVLRIARLHLGTYAEARAVAERMQKDAWAGLPPVRRSRFEARRFPALECRDDKSEVPVGR